MSEHDALVADGRVISQGAFRLDRRRAMDKLAHFQLDDPHRYVLELVAAAVCSGAPSVLVTNDADDLEISWEGIHPSLEELESLFDHIFYRGEEAHGRMLQHLAQGIFGALGLEPRWLRLQRPGLSVDLTRPEEPTQGDCSREVGTAVIVRERFSWAVVREWATAPFDATHEGRLLTRAARHCPIPIQLNGRILKSAGDFGTPVQDPAHGILDGRLQLAIQGQGATVTLVRDGIPVEALPYSVGDLCLDGWVRVDGIGLNASQSTALRDGTFSLLEKGLRGALIERLIAAPASPERAQAALHILIDGQEGCDVLDGLELFEDLSGHKWSVNQLRMAGQILLTHDPALFAPELTAAQFHDPRLPDKDPHGLAMRALRARLGDDLVRGEDLLRALAQGRQRRSELAALARPVGEQAALRHPFSEDGVEGLVAIGLLAGDPLIPREVGIHLQLRVDRLPVELRWLAGPGPVVVQVESPGMRADPSFQRILPGPEHDRAVAVARAAVDVALARAAQELPDHPRIRPVLLSWLEASSGRSSRGRATTLPPALANVPLIRTLAGSLLSAGALLDAAKTSGRRPIPYVPVDQQAPSSDPGVLSLDPPTLRALRRLLGDRLEDATQRLRAEAEAQRRRANATARPELRQSMEVRRPLSAAQLRGEIGLSLEAGPCAVEVQREGVRLATLVLPIDLPGAAAAVDWAEATPTPDWSGLADPDAAALRLAAILEAPLLALARERVVDRLAAQAPLPCWAAALLRRGREAAPELGALPFLRRADGQVYSIDELEELLADPASGNTLKTAPPGTLLDGPGARELFLADPDRIVILKRWLGEKAIRPSSGWVAELTKARRTFLLRRTGECRDPSDTRAATPFEGEGFSGSVGLDPNPEAVEGLRLDCCHQDRLLCTLRLTAPIPLVASVSGAAIEPSTHYTGLARDQIRLDVHEAIRRVLGALVNTLVERGGRSPLHGIRIHRALTAARIPGLPKLSQLALAQKIEAWPLLKLLHGSTISLREAQQLHARARLALLDPSASAERGPEGLDCVLADKETRAWLVPLLPGPPPPEVDDLVRAMVEGEARRRSLEPESLTPTGSWPASASWALADGGRLWIGLRARGAPGLELCWRVEGRPIQHEERPAAVPLLLRIQHPGLKADAAWRRPAPAALVQRLREEALAAPVAFFSWLLGTLAAPGEPGALPEGVALLLTEPQHTLQALIRFTARTPLTPAAMSTPLLLDSAGERVSLDRLRQLVQRSGPLRVVEPGTRGRPLDPDEQVIQADEALRSALGLWGRVLEATEALKDEEQIWRRRSAPPTFPAPPPGALLDLPAPGGRRGFLQVRSEGEDQVQLGLLGRPLGRVEPRGPVPLCGYVDDSALSPDAAFLHPVADAARSALITQLERASAAALDPLLDKVDPIRDRALLLRILVRAASKRRALVGASGPLARLAALPLFEDGAGGRWSPIALAGFPKGPRWVGDEVLQAPSLDPANPFIRASPPEQDLLRPLLGGRNAEAQVAAEAEAIARRAARRLPFKLDTDDCIGTISIASGPMRAQLGLHEQPGRPGSVALRAEGRPVEDRPISLPGLVGLVEIPVEAVDPVWSSATLEPAWMAEIEEGYVALVRASSPTLLERAASRDRLLAWLQSIAPRLQSGKKAAAAASLRAWREAPLLQTPEGTANIAQLLDSLARHGFVLLGPGPSPEGGPLLLCAASFERSVVALFDPAGKRTRRIEEWQEGRARASQQAASLAAERALQARNARLTATLSPILAALLDGERAQAESSRAALALIDQILQAEPDLEALVSPALQQGGPEALAISLRLLEEPGPERGGSAARLARVMRAAEWLADHAAASKQVT